MRSRSKLKQPGREVLALNIQNPEVMKKYELLLAMINGKLEPRQAEFLFLELVRLWWPKAHGRLMRLKARETELNHYRAEIARIAAAERIPKYEARKQVIDLYGLHSDDALKDRFKRLNRERHRATDIAGELWVIWWVLQMQKSRGAQNLAKNPPYKVF
jgi:hypothetical protein